MNLFCRRWVLFFAFSSPWWNHAISGHAGQSCVRSANHGSINVELVLQKCCTSPMLVLWAVLLQAWVICILSSMRWLGEGWPGKSLEESSQMECNWRETSRWAFWEWHYLLKGWTVACVRSPVLEHLECSCEIMCRSHRLRFHAWMCPQEIADCLLSSLGLGFRVPSCKGSACGSISSRLLNR